MKKVSTLIAFGLLVLTGFLIWRPAAQTVPSPSSEGSCPVSATASTEIPQEQGKVSEALPVDMPPVDDNRADSKSSNVVYLPTQIGPSQNGLPSSEPAAQPAAADKLAGQAAPPPSSKPATESAATKVVATVNGEPILESELLACLPDDGFQAELDNLKESKAKRLVEEAVQWQFLKDRKVTLSDEELQNATADFETMVMTPGCPCCGGGYKSVEQFAQVNGFSPREIRRRIICDSGLKVYAARLEKERTTPQAVKERRAEIEKNCVMAYAISFDYTRDPDLSRDEKSVQAEKQKIANDALSRLKKGDAFEKVAKDLSKAGMSDPKGGALECVRADLLDAEVQKVLGTLEPGTFSPVIKTGWGCCIVMRKKLTDEDILSKIKEQAKNLAEDQAYQELDAWRRRAKIQYSAAYAAIESDAK